MSPSSFSVHSGTDSSKGQRLKQEVSGKDLFNKVLEALWSNMKLSPLQGAIIIDLFGYDESFTESVL